MDACGGILLLFFGMVIVGESHPLGMGCESGSYLDPYLNVCQNCPPWTFSSTRNEADHCANCSKNCFDPTTAEVLHLCNATHDLICRCKSGYYARYDRSLCRRHSICPKNCLKHQGSPSSNSECYDPCPTKVVGHAVVENRISTALLANISSSLPNMTTAGSNQTASNYFLPIGVTALIMLLLIILIISCLWKKIYGYVNEKWVCRQPLYEMAPVHGGDQDLPVDCPPPPPPHRNASLGAGNDHQRTGPDQRPASRSFWSESPSDGTAEPLHDNAILPDSQQNETLPEVPNGQILPLTPGAAGEASPEEVEALLHDSQRMGSVSCPPSSHPGVPEDAYAQARLLFGSSDVLEDSPTGGPDSDELVAATNSQDFSSQMMPGLEDLQENLGSTSARPCAQVRPLVRSRPDQNLRMNYPQNPQLNHQQHLQVNQLQHPQVNHLQNPQVNHLQGVPIQVIDVESIESLSDSY